MPETFVAHTLHAQHCHCAWDNALAPALKVAPGDTITFDCRDASNGQIIKDSTVDALAAFDMTKVNPVTGPVFIDGAEPGDALKITVQDFVPLRLGLDRPLPGLRLAGR